MRKPETTLDQLTSPTVTPAILRVRAQYWRKVADRHERNRRPDQAARLRVNCDAMDRQADDLERNPAVTSIVAPRQKALGGSKGSKGKRNRTDVGEAFWRSYHDAVAAIGQVYGDRWAVLAPLGETVLVTLPAAFRSYPGPQGRPSQYRPDWRMPAAHYWPEGTLPDGLQIEPDVPRETADRPWSDERTDPRPGYAQWQDAWAKQNGLVKRGGVYLSAAELAKAAKMDARRARRAEAKAKTKIKAKAA